MQKEFCLQENVDQKKGLLTDLYKKVVKIYYIYTVICSLFVSATYTLSHVALLISELISTCTLVE